MAAFSHWSTDDLCKWLKDQTKDLNAVEMEGLIKHWRAEGVCGASFVNDMTENDWKEMVPRLALRLRVKRLIAAVQSGSVAPVATSTLPAARPLPAVVVIKPERNLSPAARARSPQPVKRGRSPVVARAMPPPAPVVATPPAGRVGKGWKRGVKKAKSAVKAKEEVAPKKRPRAASQSPSPSLRKSASLAALAAAASILTSDEDVEEAAVKKKKEEVAEAVKSEAKEEAEGGEGGAASKQKEEALLKKKEEEAALKKKEEEAALKKKEEEAALKKKEEDTAMKEKVAAGATSVVKDRAEAKTADGEAIVEVKVTTQTPVSTPEGRKRSSPGEEAANAGKTKVCQLCGKDQPLSEFHVDRNARDGLKNKCKDCKRRATQELQQKLQQPDSRTPRRNSREPVSKLERWNPDVRGDEEEIRVPWHEKKKRIDNDTLQGHLASLHSAAAAEAQLRPMAVRAHNENGVEDEDEDDVLMKNAQH